MKIYYYWQKSDIHPEKDCPWGLALQILAAPVWHHPGTADVAASETAVLAGQLTLLATVPQSHQFLLNLTLVLASVYRKLSVS